MFSGMLKDDKGGRKDLDIFILVIDEGTKSNG